MTGASKLETSLPVGEVVTNEELLKVLYDLQEKEEKRVPIFTEDEINVLRTIAKERTAFSVVFSRLRTVGGIFAALILGIMSFMIDWHHVKTLFKGVS